MFPKDVVVKFYFSYNITRVIFSNHIHSGAKAFFEHFGKSVSLFFGHTETLYGIFTFYISQYV